LDDPQKTTNLSQVTDKLYLIMLYTSNWSRFKLTTSNYHTITAMMAPCSLSEVIKLLWPYTCNISNTCWQYYTTTADKLPWCIWRIYFHMNFCSTFYLIFMYISKMKFLLEFQVNIISLKEHEIIEWADSRSKLQKQVVKAVLCDLPREQWNMVT
jgi:hypothetical protein